MANSIPYLGPIQFQESIFFLPITRPKIPALDFFPQLKGKGGDSCYLTKWLFILVTVMFHSVLFL
jgi:hypothetical protein